MYYACIYAKSSLICRAKNVINICIRRAKLQKNYEDEKQNTVHKYDEINYYSI